MSEVDRWIGVAVLGLLWAFFALYNLVFEIGRHRRMEASGPSPMVIFGSVFGLAALLLMPGLGWVPFLALLPSALLPDLSWIAGSLLFSWRERRRR